MIVGGHVSCGYCSAVIAELEPWPAGERREFVCPECGNTVGGQAPDKCPICGVPKSKFVEIA